MKTLDIQSISGLSHNNHPALKTLFDAVVIANGDFPSHPLTLQLIEQIPYVICCDGAANTLIQQGNIPDAIIGDGDSIDPSIKEKYSDLFIAVDDQETNDQTKAINHCVSIDKPRIALLGATGKREDHMLGNITLLMHYFPKISVTCFTDHGLFIPMHNEAQLSCKKGQQVSIFNFRATNLQSYGLAYPLYDFDQLWQGTLNEASQPQVYLKAEGNLLLFLNYTY